MINLNPTNSTPSNPCTGFPTETNLEAAKGSGRASRVAELQEQYRSATNGSVGWPFAQPKWIHLGLVGLNHDQIEFAWDTGGVIEIIGGFYRPTSTGWGNVVNHQPVRGQNTPKLIYQDLTSFEIESTESPEFDRICSIRLRPYVLLSLCFGVLPKHRPPSARSLGITVVQKWCQMALDLIRMQCLTSGNGRQRHRLLEGSAQCFFFLSGTGQQRILYKYHYNYIILYINVNFSMANSGEWEAGMSMRKCHEHPKASTFWLCEIVVHRCRYFLKDESVCHNSF